MVTPPPRPAGATHGDARGRARARLGEPERMAPRRRAEASDQRALDRDPPSPEPSLPDNFETELAAAREDRARARHMRRMLNLTEARSPWLTMNDREWLVRQHLRRVPVPELDKAAMRALADKLEGGVASGLAPLSLASSTRMRSIRLGLNGALFEAFADYPDEELRTVTVIYSGWTYAPNLLDGVTATKIKKQFRQHLNREGVTQVPGPLFAVLHGEFEPRSGVYVGHFHVITTAAKAAALKAGLTRGAIRGYTATATGAAPVFCSRLRDRARQFSYLVKAFWPCRPVVNIDGRWKRVRRGRRSPEPYATQVLLWLDRQRFADLVLMQDCWSPRNGGSAAMRKLYLLVMRAGCADGL